MKEVEKQEAGVRKIFQGFKGGTVGMKGKDDGGEEVLKGNQKLAYSRVIHPRVFLRRIFIYFITFSKGSDPKVLSIDMNQVTLNVLISKTFY